MKQFIILLFVALACARRPPRCRPVTAVQFEATLAQFKALNVEGNGALNSTLVTLEDNAEFFSTKNYTAFLNFCASKFVVPNTPQLFEKKSTRAKRAIDDACSIIRSSMGAVVYLQGLILEVIDQVVINNAEIISNATSLNGTIPQADFNILYEIALGTIAANNLTSTTMESLSTQQEELLGGLNIHFENQCNTTGISNTPTAQLEFVIDSFNELNNITGGTLGGVMNIFVNNSEFLLSPAHSENLLEILSFLWFPPGPSNITAFTGTTCASKNATLAQLQASNTLFDDTIFNLDQSVDIYDDIKAELEVSETSSDYAIYEELIEGAKIANSALRGISVDALALQTAIYDGLLAAYQAANC